MRLIEFFGRALRPIRSDESKMLGAKTDQQEETGYLSVNANSFANGQNMPIDCTTDGDNTFPGLEWSMSPEEAKTFVVVCEDPDIPKATPFIHLIACNIPGDSNGLPTEAFNQDGTLTEDMKNKGIVIGGNSMAQNKWMAPAPPPGHGPHHYHFQVFALDTVLPFDAPMRMPELREAMQGHVLAHGEVVGVYQRGS